MSRALEAPFSQTLTVMTIVRGLQLRLAASALPTPLTTAPKYAVIVPLGGLHWQGRLPAPRAPRVKPARQEAPAVIVALAPTLWRALRRAPRVQQVTTPDKAPQRAPRVQQANTQQRLAQKRAALALPVNTR